MNKRRAQLCSLVALSLLTLSAVGFARFKASTQEAAKQIDVASASPLQEIADYRQWTRVNEKPLVVFDASIVGG